MVQVWWTAGVLREAAQNGVLALLNEEAASWGEGKEGILGRVEDREGAAHPPEVAGVGDFVGAAVEANVLGVGMRDRRGVWWLGWFVVIVIAVVAGLVEVDELSRDEPVS